MRMKNKAQKDVFSTDFCNFVVQILSERKIISNVFHYENMHSLEYFNPNILKGVQYLITFII